MGYSVHILNEIGIGDLLVGGRGLNWVFEVKAPLGPRGGVGSGKLTEAQGVFFRDWKGQADVVRSLRQALEIINPEIRVPESSRSEVNVSRHFDPQWRDDDNRCGAMEGIG